MSEFVKVRAKKENFWFKKGDIAYVIHSYTDWALLPDDPEHMVDCWHVYVAEDKDSWVFNLFSEEDYNKHFEEIK